MKRFSKEEIISFDNDPNHYEDFIIRVLASAWNDYDEVYEQEKILLNMFPKNIWLEEYLGTPEKNYKFSGVTEIVRMDNATVKRARDYVYNLRKEWGNDD